MKIGVVGLGLMGGSLARALKKYTSHTVCGVDTDPKTLRDAYAAGAIDCDTDTSACDIVFVCLFPQASIDYMLHTEFKENAIIADICGVKRFVEDQVSRPLYERGLRYVGTHPMAGKETGGFVHSDADLYQGASFIITLTDHTDSNARAELAQLMGELGFARITECSARKHDEVIGYTSQLAHIVSNAYVKSEAAQDFRGFSAGSFMDLTRVARLDPQMWTELFLMNGDILTAEIDELIANITALRNAILTQNERDLCAMLADGSEKKERLNKEIR